METVLKNISEEYRGRMQVPGGAEPWRTGNSLNLGLCFTCFYVPILSQCPVCQHCCSITWMQYLALCSWMCSEKVRIWLLQHLAEMESESHSRLRADLGCSSQECKA